MAFARVDEIYADGRKKGYGVPMINVVNHEMIKWAIEVAEEEGMPLLIGFYPGFESLLDMEACYLITKMYAQRVKTPIALHLDHSPSLDVIAPFLRYFDSVMIDGSSLPYDENVRITREVVDVCRRMNIVVEAELGHVGSGSSIDDIQNPDKYTQPKQAADFIEATGCDALAIAIGNAHGDYIAMPNLDFGRLKEIRESVDIPLVLHGGSGIPDDQFSRCVLEGMSKFNIFTDYNLAYSNACKESLEKANQGALSMILACETACKEVVRHKMRMVNPKGLRIV